MNNNYSTLFGILKSVQTIQPISRNPFSFSAHGKDHNLNFRLQHGRIPSGQMRFRPFGKGDDGLAQVMVKTSKLLGNDEALRLVGLIAKNRQELRESVVSTFEGILYGLKEICRVSTASINNHNEFILKGILLSEEGTPTGMLDVNLTLFKKSQFETQYETLRKHLNNPRLPD